MSRDRKYSPTKDTWDLGSSAHVAITGVGVNGQLARYGSSLTCPPHISYTHGLIEVWSVL